MKVNIKGRDPNKPITFMELWIREQYANIKSVPELSVLSDEDIKKYLIGKYKERYISQGRFYNNLTNNNEVLTQEQFINMYLNEPYILTGYGCFFKNQDDVVNISSAALKNLGDMRKFFKKRMEAAEHRK